MNKAKKTGLAAVFFLMSTLFFSSPAQSAVQQDLEALKAKLSQSMDSAARQDYEKGIEDLKASGILDKALKAGAQAPDFTLPNVVGDPIRLYKMLKRGPVVLVWYQGGWSPYCGAYLKALQQSVAEFEASGAALVAVSPETPNKTFATREQQGLSFEILSDIGSDVARKFGIAYDLPGYLANRYRELVNLKEYNGSKSNTLPITAVYVINTQGKITYAFLDADYRHRPEPEVLINEVEKYSKRGS